MFDLIKYSSCGAKSMIARLQRTSQESGERSLALDSIDAETRRDLNFHASVFEAIKNNGGYYALLGLGFSGLLSLISPFNSYLKFFPLAILASLFAGAGYTKAVEGQIQAYRGEIQSAGFNLIGREIDPTDAIVIGDEVDFPEADAEDSASEIEDHEVFDVEEDELALTIE
jgi:hypothetical protein